MSARDALKRLVALGLRPRIHGDGIVAAQRPEVGTALESAIASELWLDRAPRTPPADAGLEP
jgi:hypothetical protein